MYSREIDGNEYTFGVSGKLIRNVLVMYDRQTESYWSQLLGESIEGELKGTKLEFLASWQTTWSQWVEMHPDTVALYKTTPSSYDVYEFYYRSDDAGIIGETYTDNRLFTKEFVIGVELPNDNTIAYPFRDLNEQPVLNDDVLGTPLLVVFDADSAAGVVYHRVVDNRVLTFSETDEPFILTDNETGSIWDAFSGVALSGELEGTTLTRQKSTLVFWFGWKDFHPDTLVYGLSD